MRFGRRTNRFAIDRRPPRGGEEDRPPPRAARRRGGARSGGGGRGVSRRRGHAAPPGGEGGDPMRVRALRPVRSRELAFGEAAEGHEGSEKFMNVDDREREGDNRCVSVCL